jgi:small-conductance mechanosensitive channel
MDELLNLQAYQDYLGSVRDWVVENAVALGISGALQILAVALGFLASRLAAARVARSLERVAWGWRYEQQIRRIAGALEPLTLPILWLTLLWVAVVVATQAGLPYQVVKIVVSLITAWVVIRLTTTLVRETAWSRFIAICAWTIAALNILNLLDPATEALDRMAVTFGGLRLSALLVIKAALSLAVLLWLATMAARLLERRITSAPNLTPSLRVLLSQLLKIVFVTLAIVVALNSVGIDLTAFAVFTGALGVGIGFGLQKVISNFVSGVTLLLDKSVKPGDVISVGETFGWVNSLGARYVSVVTRDGMEYLIPNENLITQQVVNWSYSSDQVRLRIRVGIAYNADVRRACALCREAAAETPRVLETPAPVCLVLGFGESSVELELRAWINDPRNGVGNVKSDVLLRIWDRFHAHGIEIPYPQRDLHLKAPLEVSLTGAAVPRRAARS